MLIGGNHKEWPEEDYFKQYHGGDDYDDDYDDLREEKWEMEQNQEYEDWLWEQVLEEGPPQSDDLTWVKKQVAFMAAEAAILTNKAGGRALTAEDASEIGVAGAKELQKRIAQL